MNRPLMNREVNGVAASLSAPAAISVQAVTVENCQAVSDQETPTQAISSENTSSVGSTSITNDSFDAPLITSTPLDPNVVRPGAQGNRARRALQSQLEDHIFQELPAIRDSVEPGIFTSENQTDVKIAAPRQRRDFPASTDIAECSSDDQDCSMQDSQDTETAAPMQRAPGTLDDHSDLSARREVQTWPGANAPPRSVVVPALPPVPEDNDDALEAVPSEANYNVPSTSPAPPGPSTDADGGQEEQASSSEFDQEGSEPQEESCLPSTSTAGVEGILMTPPDSQNNTTTSQPGTSGRPKARRRRRKATYDFERKRRPNKRKQKQAGGPAGGGEGKATASTSTKKTEDVVQIILASSNNIPCKQWLVQFLLNWLVGGHGDHKVADMSEEDFQKSAAFVWEVLALKESEVRDLQRQCTELPSPRAMKQCISGLEAIMRGVRSLSAGQKNIIKSNALCNICKVLLRILNIRLDEYPKLTELPAIESWRATLRRLMAWEGRSLVLAVLGDTGEGKSSMLNALMDLPPVLPTSGLRACTAVAIEIRANTANDKFEAEVEFLSAEEWYEELGKLLEDIPRRSDDTFRQIARDLNSEAAAALEKVKAVYGTVQPMEILRKASNVIEFLGSTRSLSLDTASALRDHISPYVESGQVGDGGQFWPVVRKVRLRIPHCPALDGGVTLVDLPGVQDANAARDRIARDYLKSCDEVWVVTSIHRALDKRTAKDMFGEHFRRQFFMDGHYSKVTFVCTKADDLVLSELCSCKDLNLTDCQKELEELNEKEINIRNMRDAYEKTAAEIAFIRDTMAEIKQDVASGKYYRWKLGGDKKTQRRSLQEATVQLASNMDVRRRMNAFSTEQMPQLRVAAARLRKKLSAKCARARNEFSSRRIREDLKRGLKELHRSKNQSTDEETCDSDTEEDEWAAAQASGSRVFCVSAVEYCRFRALYTEDGGEPQVFDRVEETQIPALREHLHSLSATYRQKALEEYVISVGQFLLEVQNGWTSVQSQKGFHEVRAILGRHSKGLQDRMQTYVDALCSSIQDACDKLIAPPLLSSVEAAVDCAKATVASWALKPEETEDGRGLGLCYLTYKAVLRRNGEFTSRKYGLLDFNADLSEPLMTSICLPWDKVFNEHIKLGVKRLNGAIAGEVLSCRQRMDADLTAQGITLPPTDSSFSDRTLSQLNLVGNLEVFITDLQRSLSRTLIQHVKLRMKTAYLECLAKRGSGAFQLLKGMMLQAVDPRTCRAMFTESAETLLENLHQIPDLLKARLATQMEFLKTSVSKDYELLPFQEANNVPGNAQFIQSITRLCEAMVLLYEEAGLPVPAENPRPAIPPDGNYSRHSDDEKLPGCSESFNISGIGNLSRSNIARERAASKFLLPAEQPPPNDPMFFLNVSGPLKRKRKSHAGNPGSLRNVSGSLGHQNNLAMNGSRAPRNLLDPNLRACLPSQLQPSLMGNPAHSSTLLTATITDLVNRIESANVGHRIKTSKMAEPQEGQESESESSNAADPEHYRRRLQASVNRLVASEQLRTPVQLASSQSEDVIPNQDPLAAQASICSSRSQTSIENKTSTSINQISSSVAPPSGSRIANDFDSPKLTDNCKLSGDNRRAEPSRGADNTSAANAQRSKKPEVSQPNPAPLTTLSAISTVPAASSPVNSITVPRTSSRADTSGAQKSQVPVPNPVQPSGTLIPGSSLGGPSSLRRPVESTRSIGAAQTSTPQGLPMPAIVQDQKYMMMWTYGSNLFMYFAPVYVPELDATFYMATPGSSRTFGSVEAGVVSSNPGFQVVPEDPEVPEDRHESKPSNDPGTAKVDEPSGSRRTSIPVKQQQKDLPQGVPETSWQQCNARSQEETRIKIVTVKSVVRTSKSQAAPTANAGRAFLSTSVTYTSTPRAEPPRTSAAVSGNVSLLQARERAQAAVSMMSSRTQTQGIARSSGTLLVNNDTRRPMADSARTSAAVQGSVSSPQAPELTRTAVYMMSPQTPGIARGSGTFFVSNDTRTPMAQSARTFAVVQGSESRLPAPELARTAISFMSPGTPGIACSPGTFIIDNNTEQSFSDSPYAEPSLIQPHYVTLEPGTAFLSEDDVRRFDSMSGMVPAAPYPQGTIPRAPTRQASPDNQAQVNTSSGSFVRTASETDYGGQRVDGRSTRGKSTKGTGRGRGRPRKTPSAEGPSQPPKVAKKSKKSDSTPVKTKDTTKSAKPRGRKKSSEKNASQPSAEASSSVAGTQPPENPSSMEKNSQLSASQSVQEEETCARTTAVDLSDLKNVARDDSQKPSTSGSSADQTTGKDAETVQRNAAQETADEEELPRLVPPKRGKARRPWSTFKDASPAPIPGLPEGDGVKQAGTPTQPVITETAQPPDLQTTPVTASSSETAKPEKRTKSAEDMKNTAAGEPAAKKAKLSEESKDAGGTSEENVPV